MLSCKEESQKELMREQISSALVNQKPHKLVFLSEKKQKKKFKNSSVTQCPSAYRMLWNSSAHAVLQLR